MNENDTSITNVIIYSIIRIFNFHTLPKITECIWGLKFQGKKSHKKYI